MSVRQSLLAILDQGPCYGYQLRAEFDRRTGSTWPLNVGQIYNTLDRLERDGLVAKGDTDEQGHVYWRITDAGSAAARAWLADPVERGGTRDELAIKIAVAATLPGVDIAAVIAAQRAASAARLEGLRQGSGPDPEVPRTPAPTAAEDLARALIADAMACSAEAELRWLDRAAALLARHPEHATALGLSADKPKRGRPARGAR